MRARASFFPCCILLAASEMLAAGEQGTPQPPPNSNLAIHPSLISLDSDDGRRLLWESRAREDFIPLSSYFTTQKSLAYCGVASGTMVLNGLPVDRPASEHHHPYRLFTQENFFSDATDRAVDRSSVARSGMTLRELGDVMGTFPVKVEVTHAAESSVASFREEAVRTLRDRDSYLIVNYLRKAIHQETGGHFSPVAAYHQGEDRFLILDVARYKYPPVWVKAEVLWDAMVAVDSSSGKSRGYLFVRAAPALPDSPNVAGPATPARVGNRPD